MEKWSGQVDPKAAFLTRRGASCTGTIMVRVHVHMISNASWTRHPMYCLGLIA